MGRDFANKGRPTRNPRPSNSNTYHWSWLLAGTAIGFVISAIAYFKLFPILSTHLVEVAVEETVATPIASTPARTASFDFYSLLPQLEVEVPAVEKQSEKTMTLSAVPESAPTPALKDNPLPPHQPPASTAGPMTYRLQLASFRQYKDADSLKAQMALSGMEVEIEAVNLGPNDTWFRVQSLPYPNRASAESAHQQLQAQSIQSMILEERG